MKTLAQVASQTGFAVLEHLEAEAQVPVLPGLQAQGDLFIIPVSVRGFSGGEGKPVPPEGIAIIEAAGGGHEHRLYASVPGTAHIEMLAGAGQDIAYMECTEPAYSLHMEHGATGIAPGAFVFRRQREQADEERLVAD